MGPVGCILGLIAQVIHMIVLVVSLPFVIISSFFRGRK